MRRGIRAESVIPMLQCEQHLTNTVHLCETVVGLVKCHLRDTDRGTPAVVPAVAVLATSISYREM